VRWLILGASFFLVGAAAPRRFRVPVMWLLLPIVAAYVLAIVAQPHVYRCNPVTAAACRVILAPFVVSAAAVAVGYLFQRRGLSARASA
jgi:hypothetical protein